MNVNEETMQYVDLCNRNELSLQHIFFFDIIALWVAKFQSRRPKE